MTNLYHLASTLYVLAYNFFFAVIIIYLQSWKLKKKINNKKKFLNRKKQKKN